MIALYILLAVLLLLFLITLIKVEIFAAYTDVLRLTLKVLFVRKTLLPDEKKPKKPKKKTKKKPKKKQKEQQKGEEQPKKKEKKPSYLSKLKEKKGLSGLVSLLLQAARIAAGTLKGIFSHIVIKKLDVGIALSSGDAATTAVNYGKLCSAVYPAVDIITAATVCKDYRVTLEPVFDDEKDTEVYADIHAYIRILFILIEGMKAGVKLLLARMKLSIGK